MSSNQRTSFEVPPELTTLLLDFTVNVLLNQPKGDLIEYAANYFQQLLQERKNGNTNTRSPNDSSMDESNHMTEDDEEISTYNNVLYFMSFFLPYNRCLLFMYRSKIATRFSDHHKISLCFDGNG